MLPSAVAGALWGAIYAAHLTVPIVPQLALTISGALLKPSKHGASPLSIRDGRADLRTPAGVSFALTLRIPF